MTERAPEDDFDEVGSSLRGRRGAHRQAPRRLASVLPVVGVLTAVVAVGWAVTAAVGLTGGGGAASTSAESAAVSTPQATTSSPADTPTTDAPTPGTSSTATSATGASTSDGSAPVEETAAGVPPAAETSASSSSSSSAPSSSSPSSAAAVVDEDVDVIVLNATRTSGLAATTASALEADGWTVASTGNERDAQPAVTVVLFPSADLEATAIAVAGDLGSKVVARLDASAADDAITVLAGPDRVR